MVGLAVVDVEIERPLLSEQPARLLQARGEEAEVVLEGVAIGGLREQLRAIASTLKADPLAILVAYDRQRPAHLCAARVEGRVDVHQLEGPRREARQQLEVLTQQDLIALGWFSREHQLQSTSPRRWSSAASGAAWRKAHRLRQSTSSMRR